MFLPRSPIGLLSVSGLLQPRNESTSFSQLAPGFYHEWIHLQFLARVDEDAVFSDSAHSGGGGGGADAVVAVALHGGAWVSLDWEALVRWVVLGDPRGSCLVVGPREARARQLAREGLPPALLVVPLFDVGWALVSILFRGSQ